MENSVSEKCVLTPLHPGILGLYDLYAWALVEETENSKNSAKFN